MTPGVIFIDIPARGRRKRRQLALYGEFAVFPDKVERAAIHGYQELPRIPYVDCDLNALPENTPELDTLNDVTIVTQLANGKIYTLSGAGCRGLFDRPGPGGVLRVRFEGAHCEEIKLPVKPRKRRRKHRRKVRAKRRAKR